MGGGTGVKIGGLEKRFVPAKTGDIVIFKIPTVWKEVDLGKPGDIDRRISALSERDGDGVLIKDSYYSDEGSYLLVRLRINPEDKTHYYAQRVLSGTLFSENEYYFRKLEGLMVDKCDEYLSKPTVVNSVDLTCKSLLRNTSFESDC